MPKCRECKEMVDKELAIRVKVSKETAKNVAYGNFHKDCYELYLLKQEENKKWDDLYEYVRSEILEYDKAQSLDRHKVDRLQGLRSGEYKQRKGKKVSLSENGYPYEAILMTFKVKKIAIKQAMAERSKFKDDKHMFDYIMIIVESEINDVYQRMKEKEKTDKALQSLDFSKYQSDEYEYKDKNDIKENKVAKLLNDLW